MNQFRPARLRMIGVSVGFAMIATLGLSGPAHAEEPPSVDTRSIEQVQDAASLARHHQYPDRH